MLFSWAVVPVDPQKQGIADVSQLRHPSHVLGYRVEDVSMGDIIPVSAIGIDIVAHAPETEELEGNDGA